MSVVLKFSSEQIQWESIISIYDTFMISYVPANRNATVNEAGLQSLVKEHPGRRSSFILLSPQMFSPHLCYSPLTSHNSWLEC